MIRDLETPYLSVSSTVLVCRPSKFEKFVIAHGMFERNSAPLAILHAIDGWRSRLSFLIERSLASHLHRTPRICIAKEPRVRDRYGYITEVTGRTKHIVLGFILLTC